MRKLHLPIGFGLSVGGLLLGHWLSYGLASSDGHELRELLGHSHGYLAWGARAAAVLTLVCLLRAFSNGARGALSAPLGSRWAMLSVLQAGSFVVLEVVERLAVGAPLTHLPKILAIGIPLQVAVAFFSALLLRAVHRLGALVGQKDHASRPRTVTSIAVPLRLAPDSTLEFCLTRRGPPRAAFS